MRNVATSIFYLKLFARIYEAPPYTLFLSVFSSPSPTLYPYIYLPAIFLDSLGLHELLIPRYTREQECTGYRTSCRSSFLPPFSPFFQACQEVWHFIPAWDILNLITRKAGHDIVSGVANATRVAPIYELSSGSVNFHALIRTSADGVELDFLTN